MRCADQAVEEAAVTNPWPTPTALWVTGGAGEDTTELNAFDNALLAAGIGELNLIKVSSVVPPGAQVLATPPTIAPGSLVPSVYATASSQAAGETICAALGVGIGPDAHGMIFEHAASSREAGERTVSSMVEEGFARRGLKLDRLIVRVVEHRVERVGCAVAAAVLWWG